MSAGQALESVCDSLAFIVTAVMSAVTTGATTKAQGFIQLVTCLTAY